MGAALLAIAASAFQAVVSIIWNTHESVYRNLDILRGFVHTNGGEGKGERESFSSEYEDEVKAKLQKANQRDLDAVYEEIQRIRHEVGDRLNCSRNLLMWAIHEKCFALAELLITERCPYLENNCLPFLAEYHSEAAENKSNGWIAEALAAKLLNNKEVATNDSKWRKLITEVLVRSINDPEIGWLEILGRARSLKDKDGGTKCCNEALAHFLMDYVCEKMVSEALSQEGWTLIGGGGFEQV